MIFNRNLLRRRKKTETENKTKNKICDENNILMWFQETFIQR